jgi:hypothetical protein
MVDAALSHRAVVGGCTFLGGGGGVKPTCLDFQWSVDHLGTCVTKSYMK